MNNRQQKRETKAMKPQREFLYIIMVSLVFATVMLLSSTIFADTEYSQTLIMPLIAMGFAPFFLAH